MFFPVLETLFFRWEETYDSFWGGFREATIIGFLQDKIWVLSFQTVHGRGRSRLRVKISDARNRFQKY